MFAPVSIFVIDGSLEGLLTAVFEWFDRKPGKVLLQLRQEYQPDAFSEAFEVLSDREKAGRVWKGLSQRLDHPWMRRICCACLSEDPQAFRAVFGLAQYLFSAGVNSVKNFGNPDVLFVAQTAKKVEREKHRMEAFIRFKKLEDGRFYAGISPDFDILPLIASHFRNRYAGQPWLIFDLKRRYGLSYDTQHLEEVTFEGRSLPVAAPHHAEEDLYASLWKHYFKSTNIAARKNTALHIRHVPKRYWQYLTEKQ